MWVSSPDTTPGDLPNNSGIFDPAANSAADCCTTERCPGQDLVWMPRDKCDCMTFVWCCPLRPVSARNVTLWSPLSRGSQAQGRSARRAGSRPELHAVAQLAAAQLDANLLGGRASRAQTELLHKAASVNRSIRNSGNNKPQFKRNYTRTHVGGCGALGVLDTLCHSVANLVLINHININRIYTQTRMQPGICRALQSEPTICTSTAFRE